MFASSSSSPLTSETFDFHGERERCTDTSEILMRICGAHGDNETLTRVSDQLSVQTKCGRECANAKTRFSYWCKGSDECQQKGAGRCGGGRTALDLTRPYARPYV